MPEELKAPESGATFVPVETYQIKVTIGDLDYTGDLISANFKSSLSTGYQVMNLLFEIDPTDVIVNELYGGQEIKVAIILMRETAEIGPRIDLELLLITSDFQLNEKATDSTNKQKDRGMLTVRTVVRPAYQILNGLVNGVFLGSNINSIVTSLASGLDAKVVFDTDFRNDETIDQVCIPPTTFYKIIKEYDRNNPEVFDGFLDQRFGIFDGVPAVFCQYDKTVYIKNLTAKMSKSPVFTIYQMASDTEVKRMEEIINKSIDGETFYTYDTIHTDYSANAKFASLASDINHIVKPKDTLSVTLNQSLENVAATHGLIFQNKMIFKDSAIERKKYYNEDTGNETSSTIFNSRFSRQVADLSTISINLERNLPVLGLIQVGECVDFKPLIVDYMNLSGKYILWSVDIMFTRPSTWETVATVNLIRTNKTSGQTVKPQQQDLAAVATLKEFERGKQLNETAGPAPVTSTKNINWGRIERLDNKIEKAERNINEYCGGIFETLSSFYKGQCSIWRKEVSAAKFAMAEEAGTSPAEAQQMLDARSDLRISEHINAIKVSENKQQVKPYQEKSKETLAGISTNQKRINELQKKIDNCNELLDIGIQNRGCSHRTQERDKAELQRLIAEERGR